MTSPAAGTPASRGARSARHVSTLVGSLVALVGLGFVARALLADRETVVMAVTGARPYLLLAAVVTAAAALAGIGLAWRHCVGALGGRLGAASSLYGYFVGQLGKYIPGGVWAILGRGEWARRDGVPRAVAYSSVLLSDLAAYLAAALLALGLAPFALLGGDAADARYALTLLLLPAGLALLHPRVLAAGMAVLRRLSRRDLELDIPPWGTSAVLVLRHLPSWALVCVATALVAAAFGHTGSTVNVAFAATVSWLVGYLALPVPGGIGVREAAFVALATTLPTGIAATTALVARLVFVAADASGAALASALAARARARETGA